MKRNSSDDSDMTYLMSSTKTNKRCCFSRYYGSILATVAFVFLVTGAVLALTNACEEFVKTKIRNGVKLKAGNTVYDEWLHFKTPIYIKYYIFNVTNSDEVCKGGTPNIQELGPYTYRLFFNRRNISRQKSSLSYFSTSTYFFKKKLSCDLCDPFHDNVTTVNLPFLATLEMIMKYIEPKDPSGLVVRVLDNIFMQLSLPAFHTRTINDLLWGYEDIQLAQAIGLLSSVAKFGIPSLHVDFPKRLAYVVNMSSSPHTIDTGEEDVQYIGKILKWNHSASIPCWKDKYARMINGSDGERFKPFLEKDDILYSFVVNTYSVTTMTTFVQLLKMNGT
ncbi:lysosome membrane protein 2-like [Xenia sp. Carnegie-2017]|uniref:lysosome membrane protein 2-like n=1 Tax=Xenia sp. Carnegie-2017 TaxID=2897299 RepID=UPI001F0334CF|nr:lysosome membrane protein 2-like [Xenia sp. Carnegie-2017]